MFPVLAALALALGALVSPPAVAQELEPRTYVNIPMRQNFVGFGYTYSDGDLNPAPSVPIRDAKLTLQTTAVAYVRSLDLWGRAGKIDFNWARVCFEGSAIYQGERVSGDRCGSSDPAVRLSYLFYGAPSLTMQEFRVHQPQRVIGASLQVQPPLGDYNNENLINSGAHRWTFKPELGISNVYGKWRLDAACSARLFTDNDRFAGHYTLEQDLLYQVQAHVIYTFPRGRWLALDANYFWGGESQLNGEDRHDRQENSRVGLTLGWPINTQQQLKFYASHGVLTRIGNDFDSLGLVWQYRWGE